MKVAVSFKSSEMLELRLLVQPQFSPLVHIHYDPGSNDIITTIFSLVFLPHSVHRMDNVHLGQVYT